MLKLFTAIILFTCHYWALSQDENENAFVLNVDDLSYDENKRLLHHQLLFNGDNKCTNILRSIADFLPQELVTVNRITNESFFKEFVVDDVVVSLGKGCNLIYLQAGTHHDLIYYPLPFHILTLENTPTTNDVIEPWVYENCFRYEIGFINYLENDLILYWIEDATNIREVSRVSIGGEENTLWETGYLGHSFKLVDSVTQETVYEFTVNYHSVIGIGTKDYQIPNWDLKADIKDSLDKEWDRSHVVKRTFTELGFNRGKLPLDLFSSMSTFYYNNMNNKIKEEWGTGDRGLFVNWWEKDVYFISMPEQLKMYWQTRLKELVEAWTGVELEYTSIYGLRQYEEGARLLTHVDRTETHAASLIINVAQGNIIEPWNIEIYDFADRLHEIEMNPGDIVYYESARCLHGRMQPLKGSYYVNLFAHYRPIGDPEWYTRENHPDTPKPLIDIGECNTMYHNNRNKTIVKCSKDDNNSVPFLSPKLQTLKSPTDLFKFWEEVSPISSNENSKIEIEKQSRDEL
eukprot:gene12979-17404_t